MNSSFGCLREGKNPGKKIKSKFLQDDEEKKQNCPPTKDQPEAELPPWITQIKLHVGRREAVTMCLI